MLEKDINDINIFFCMFHVKFITGIIENSTQLKFAPEKKILELF